MKAQVTGGLFHYTGPKNYLSFTMIYASQGCCSSCKIFSMTSHFSLYFPRFTEYPDVISVINRYKAVSDTILSLRKWLELLSGCIPGSTWLHIWFAHFLAMWEIQVANAIGPARGTPARCTFEGASGTGSVSAPTQKRKVN